MEVAGQWRREWAGTAEYGKVTEGGVTRRVARAMEVVNAVGPGARMRVMRAAYHSSAGPGIPASSYMLHSSRRVISSGFNLLESPSLPSKPLEISSTPLEPFRDLSAETENYKVTEPDDTEISEPSKWKVASSGNSTRMPSEESSSTDNASIIDLDSRYSHKNAFRKYSYDSDTSHDMQPCNKNSSRASPLLDAPVTLSTLKYKSLLNGSNDWNNRRKSYSFEDTCPANETIIHSNDTLAMESSTDSGICKSTEIVNDQDDTRYSTYLERKDKKHDETFKDWLHKNRPNSFYKGSELKPCKEYELPIENKIKSSIALQSPGKVSITVPITIEGEGNRYVSEDGDRRVKKVEFCKTELHFAAESGKVNIIATDEKPPPSNDFRKRRSAFVPITDKFDKPITLFGEKGDITGSIKTSSFSIYSNSETNDYENENTAATKSILKNKIPKPKPYLLGENMVLGNSESLIDKDQINDGVVPPAVSLINKQLQTEKKYNNEKNVSTSLTVDANHHIRTVKNGPSRTPSSNLESVVLESENMNTPMFKIENNVGNKGSVTNKLSALQMSPVQKPKTRKLRESDLMYFGIDDSKNSMKDNRKYVESVLTTHSSLTDDIFQSVKLIKQISSSACNSEAESEDSPDYQNVPFKTNFAPIPTPRPRSKYENTTEIDSDRLQPIMEQSSHATNVVQSRRSRSRRYEDVVVPTPRSRSEPAKKRTNVTVDNKIQRRGHVHVNSLRDSPSPRSKQYQEKEKSKKMPSAINSLNSSVSEDDTPLYVNLEVKGEHHTKSKQRHDFSNEDHMNNLKTRNVRNPAGSAQTNTITKTNIGDDILQRAHRSVKKSNNVQRTKKLVTPENSVCNQLKTDEDVVNSSRIKQSISNTHKHINENNTPPKIKERRSTPSQSQRRLNKTDESTDKSLETKRVTATIKDDVEKTSKYRNKYSSKDQMDIKKEPLKQYHNANLDDKVKKNIAERKGDDTITNSKKASHRTPKRREYVINYDDKNGTVSSVCKVKTGHSTSKRKTVTESPKEIKVKNKTLDKTPLLQLPDQQWNQNGFAHEHRKWKTKIHVQRSCQLL